MSTNQNIQTQGLYETTVKVISQKVSKFRLPKFKSSMAKSANSSSISQSLKSSSKNCNFQTTSNILQEKIVLKSRDLELLNKSNYFLVVGIYENNDINNVSPVFLDKKYFRIRVDGNKIPINNLTYNIDFDGFEQAPQFIDIGYCLGLKKDNKNKKFGVYQFKIEMQNLSEENNQKYAEILIIKKAGEKVTPPAAAINRNQNVERNVAERPISQDISPRISDETKENHDPEPEFETQINDDDSMRGSQQMLPESELNMLNITAVTDISVVPKSPKMTEVERRTQFPPSVTNSPVTKFRKVEQFIQSLDQETEDETKRMLIEFLIQQNQRLINESSINASTRNFIRIKMRCPITMQCLKTPFIVRYHHKFEAPTLIDHFQPLHAKNLIAFQKQLSKKKLKNRKQNAFFTQESFEFPKICPLTKNRKHKIIKRQPFLFRNVFDPSIPGCLEAEFCDVFLDEDRPNQLKFKYGLVGTRNLSEDPLTIDSQQSYGENSRRNLKIKAEISSQEEMC